MVKQSGTAPIAMDYDMEKTPAGWKVYDIKVAGVSLVTTYRDSFAERIRDDGVDGLIKALEEKNRQGECPVRRHPGPDTGVRDAQRARANRNSAKAGKKKTG